MTGVPDSDKTDDVTDENGAFIYPDLETALVGRFNVTNYDLIEASEATIGSVTVRRRRLKLRRLSVNWL